jgi:hypothetical protein
MLTLLLACAPCESLTGYHEGSVLGDREGLVSLDVEMLDEDRLDISGWWLPEGLPNTGEPNLVTTRGCSTSGPTVLDFTQGWYDRLQNKAVEWTGQITLRIDQEGVHGGWDMEIWSGQDGGELFLDEELVGQWRAEPLE